MEIKVDGLKVGELETFELGEKRPPKIRELSKRFHKKSIEVTFRDSSCGDPYVVVYVKK